MAATSDTNSEWTSNNSAARRPLLLLLASGLLWLVASGGLGIIASFQLNNPTFFSDIPSFTYGRVSAFSETAFVYGWLANTGLALALWVLGRLSGEPLRAQNWAITGTVFWNIGVTFALLGVATGDATGFELLGLPSYVHLIMFFSYGAIAVSGLLAWSGRLRKVPYASHWYAATALFALPWILSIAHVMLFTTPVRGVLQAIVAGWYAQAAWTFWLAPLFLSVAYYVVPKVTRKVLPSYEFAALGFWCLIFVGGLTGGRHLVGGPVPAWIPTVAVVSCALLLFHTCVVTLNLRSAFSGKAIALRFISFGIGAYFLGAIVDAATSFRGVAAHTQFTYFGEAQRQMALYATASTILFGGIYYALPLITGKAWFSRRLVRTHLLLAITGILFLVGSLCFSALVQSHDLLDPKVQLARIFRHTRPWLLIATLARATLLAGNIVFLSNFCLTTCWLREVSQPASCSPPTAMEAPGP
jgi:cytochrome c oxidase cbb3-type subunit I